MILIECNIRDFFKEITIFSELKKEQYNFITPLCDVIKIEQKELLFNQGEEIDFLYIIISGKLSVILTTENNEKRYIATMLPGETIGELSLLSQKSRTASVYAITDSLLIRISRKNFLRIITEIPEILLKLINPLVSRYRNLVKKLGEKENTHIFLISDHKDSRSEDFLLNIKNRIQDKIYFFDTRKLNENDILTTLNKHDSSYNKILCSIDLDNLFFIDYYLNRIDNIYFLSSDSNVMKIDMIFKDQLKKVKDKNRIHCIRIYDQEKPDLDELHQEDLYHSYHHVRFNNERDYQSIIRYITGNQIGLVLGGGGVKGWIHLGALKAIQEMNIPIDVIGGTSSGAIAGACYASCENYELTVKKFETIMWAARKPFRVNDFCWPTISLFTGKAGTLSLKKVFSTQSLDDLLIPFFCISSNMSICQETMHTTGLLWEKLRASISLPGLIPPMIINREVHLDGGLTNNLPVDRMRSVLGANGKIIAVNISGNKPGSKAKLQYFFPPIISNWELIKHYLSFKKYSFPKFGNLLITSLLMGSAAKEIDSCRSCDLLISPNIAGYNMIGITKKQEQELIDIGYKETIAIIQQYGLSKLII